ncbi:MAG: psp operon transcriptional activator [Gammaproteobacteria bacterium]|jgi:psp operon transcriptional activator
MTRPHEEIIGRSNALTRALEHLSQLAPINRPVLIVGERGTGKELAAARVHYLSERWEQPLIKVNCAAISNELLESELFGHEPGAFTGATRTHQGRFERADGGTLFLDELATMSSRLQEKLLRLIEYGEFERLGGQKTLYVDVRIVAATNANLIEEAKLGRFREDLLDRLSFDVVHLPPLRFRQDDIEQLAHHFALQMCRELDWEYFSGFTDKALAQLRLHTWPGNVRELKNVVERSVYRWANPKKKVAEIILNPFDSPYQQTTSNPASRSTEQETSADSHLKSKRDDSLTAQTTPLSTSLHPNREESSFTALTNEFEVNLLRNAMNKYYDHQGHVAEALGLSYHQLRGLLRKHQLTGTQKPS